jgi:hypothetical protein
MEPSRSGLTLVLAKLEKRLFMPRHPPYVGCWSSNAWQPSNFGLRERCTLQLSKHAHQMQALVLTKHCKVCALALGS